MTTQYLTFETGGSSVTWPDPRDPNEVEWRLRYGEPTREDLLYAASVLSAYDFIASLSHEDRNRYLIGLQSAARKQAVTS